MIRRITISMDVTAADRLLELAGSSRNNYVRRRSIRMSWAEARSQLIHSLGGRCYRCDYSDFESALSFRRRMNAKGTDTFLNQFIQRYTNNSSAENWQLLLNEGERCGLFCANCLAALRAGDWEYGE